MEFKAARTDKPVRRYRLTFNSPEDFQEAMALCDEKGFIRFYNGGEKPLIGHPIRAIEEDRIIEVDAAEDISTA